MRTVAAGQSLAGYNLIEMAGAGGMGRVYRAVQPGVDRVVALKVIRPDLASEPAFRDRFEVESRLVASIDHRNVIPVYEAGDAEGVLFVVMRWVDGPDLRQVIAAEAPLEPGRAVDLLEQVAAGLDAAHAEGLVHRDIKPGNVLLEGDHAFLSDFGLAQPTFGSDEATQAGGVVGTVDYLAPEVVAGGLATVAGDIYALGSVLFQMLTGSVPFPVDGLIAKLHAHAEVPAPPPCSLRPQLPRGFDEVLAKALAKDPTRRYATAGELAAAAGRALGTAPYRPRRQSRTRRRGALAGVGGAAVLAAAAAALVLLLPGTHRDPALPGSGGRTLPAAASLPPCGDLLTAPAGTCRGSSGGVDVLAEVGMPARLHSLDFKVTGVVQAPAIIDPDSGETVTASPGHRFILVECAVTNRLRRVQAFEPDQERHRQTALYLYDSSGDELPPQGPRFANYSAQTLPATGLIPLSLVGKRVEPVRILNVPLPGVLVFSYPAAELRSAHSLLLFVHEFGSGIGDERSVGVIRVTTGEIADRRVYRAAVA